MHVRKRRWYYLAALTVLLVVGGVLLVAALQEPPGLTRHDFDRIEIGMTWSEIDSTLSLSNRLSVTISGNISSDDGRILMVRKGTWSRPPVYVFLFFEQEKLLDKSWTEEAWLPYVWHQIKERLGL